MFAGAVADGGIVKGIRVPEGSSISNSRIKPKGDIASECPQGFGLSAAAPRCGVRRALLRVCCRHVVSRSPARSACAPLLTPIYVLLPQ